VSEPRDPFGDIWETHERTERSVGQMTRFVFVLSAVVSVLLVAAMALGVIWLAGLVL